ncbi:hypothetical protein HDV01_003053 [Terramyces sp. JEL0728]|nr:hypothetical protein HDV01_003053 [Terramyces sp. JEL0728]
MHAEDVLEVSDYGAWCIDYCAYHNKLTIDGVDIAYASMGSHGNPGIRYHCTLCEFSHRVSPNLKNYDHVNGFVIDTAARMIVNPQGPSSSWADQFGREGSDACSNGMYGHIDQLTYLNSTGQFANMNIGGIWTQVAMLPNPATNRCHL